MDGVGIIAASGVVTTYLTRKETQGDRLGISPPRIMAGGKGSREEEEQNEKRGGGGGGGGERGITGGGWIITWVWHE